MTAMNETPGNENNDGVDAADNAADESLDAADPNAPAATSPQPAAVTPAGRSANIGHT